MQLTINGHTAQIRSILTSQRSQNDEFLGLGLVRFTPFLFEWRRCRNGDSVFSLQFALPCEHDTVWPEN